MNKNYVILLVVLLIGGGIVALTIYTRQFSPKYEWSTDYTKNSKQPYGLKLFYNVLKEQSKEKAITSNQVFQNLDTNRANSSLVFIGHELDVNAYDAWYILNYVSKGNVALISCRNAPFELTRSFVPETDTIDRYDYYYNDSVDIDFTKAAVPFPDVLKFHYQYLKKPDVTYWAGYHTHYFTDTLAAYGFAPVSYIRDTLVNCYFINHGKGKIIFHTNPILFSNYHMVRKEGFEHANNMLSLLNNGPIYWNENGPLSDYGQSSAQSNPLAFLFSHYALRWGWYLFLATVILFLVFRSKREQRIIPVLPKNVNTSVEFTKAIGTLYHQRGGYNHIAREMYLVFLSEVRNRYYIPTDVEEETLIDQLTQRSGLELRFVVDLFSQFRNVQFSPEAKAKELVNLYSTIEQYHKLRK